MNYTLTLSRGDAVLLPAPWRDVRPEGVHQVCEGTQLRHHRPGRREARGEVQVQSISDITLHNSSFLTLIKCLVVILFGEMTLLFPCWQTWHEDAGSARVFAAWDPRVRGANSAPQREAAAGAAQLAQRRQGRQVPAHFLILELSIGIANFHSAWRESEGPS